MVLANSSSKNTKDLRMLMRKLGIFEKDIKEDFVRSSGPGGQNVNKVSTCVVLRHIPTGIKVKSQQERTQGMNRTMARRTLAEKIEHKQKTAKQKIINDRERKKRQNRKRPRALKESILEGKHQRSQKKQARRKVRTHKFEEF